MIPLPVSWVVPVLEDNSGQQEFREINGMAVACYRLGKDEWVLLCFSKEDGTFEEKSMREIKGQI